MYNIQRQVSDDMTDEDSSKDRIDQLIERLDQLETYLRQNSARLYAIEKRLGLAQQFQPPPRVAPETKREPRSSPPVAPAPPAIEVASPREPKPVTTDLRPRETQPRIAEPRIEKPAVAPPPAQSLNASAQQRPPAVSAARATSKAKTRGDLESRIGGNWFNRIGIIAVALGVGFFLKYAFDNQWIGAWGRVIIGIVIGLGFLGAGERLRLRYRNYAFGLTGGGILILYLSIFAGYEFLGIINPVPAFISMAIVTATASLLSARYTALPIAVLGLIGGFLTPVLLSTGHDNEAGLFGYIALLDLGVLALAYSKQWRSLNYMAFAGTELMFAAWWDRWYEPEKLWLTIFFLTLFFAIFALLAVLYNVVNRRPTLWLDLTLVFLNALLYFGTSYGLLEEADKANLGLFAILVSGFYLWLGYFTFRRDREDRLLLYTFWGLAILFAVLAVPIQFNQHWVTMSWAIEGAILSWIGLRAEDKTSRYASLIVFLIAVSHWLLVDVYDFAYHANEAFVPLLNRRALSCAVLVAALSATVSFYKRFGSKIEAQERSMLLALYTLGANALAVTLLSIDAHDYFESPLAEAFEHARRPDNFYSPDHVSRIIGAKTLTLSALWIIYGGTALTIGIKRNLKALRAGALLLLAGAGAKLLAIDLNFYNAGWHRTIFNQTFAAFALFVAVCAIGAWLYSKSKDVSKEERSLALFVLVGAANLFAIIALSTEAVGHFERAIAVASGNEPVSHLENMKQFALSAVWVIYGALSLIAGIIRGRKFLRMASLGLLALATVKLIVVDLSYYNAGWHWTLFNQTFGAFALLIASLVAGAWYYNRARSIDEKERAQIIPILLGAANLLALVALSAEIMGHFARARATLDDRAISMSGLDRANNNEMMMLSVLWITYGAVSLITGIKRDSKWLRVGALGLLAASTIKILAADFHWYDANWHSLIFNQTFATFALLVAALGVSIRFYSRADFIDESERLKFIPVMIAGANALAILALSAESYGYYSVKINAMAGQAERLDDLRLAQQLSISVIWTVYGGALLTIGILRRSRLLRLMALMLLGLTIFKVFLLDLSSLEKIYRIISFIVLGAILLTVSFLYQRARQRTTEMEMETDEPIQPEVDNFESRI